MFNTFLSGWNWMRIIRLVLGITLLIQAWQTKFWGAGLLGGLLLFQAFTNTGCCGTAGCGIPASKINTTKKNVDDIEYEEVK
ncbi:MAG: hypothetical protein ACK5NK_12395 [Niabella sp.]